MITDALMGLSSIPFNLLFWILPDWFPSIINTFNSAIIYIFSYANSVDFVFPVREMFICLTFVIYFEISMFSIRLVLWLLSFVPFLSVSRLDAGTTDVGFSTGVGSFKQRTGSKISTRRSHYKSRGWKSP